MNQPQTPSGILLVDKPSGITSFDCIRRLRKQLGIKKIGHAGTLDPMATGLMIFLVGSSTKLATSCLKLAKSYDAEITLGFNSATADKEGELTAVSEIVPTLEEVEKALEVFTGLIKQTPPAYSAIKIGGKPAYKRARSGEQVEIPEREVNIYKLDLISYEYPILKISTHVSSGTYIRTLAEDIGKQLGTGAYLSGLRRTTIGGFSIEKAKPLESVNQSDLFQRTA